MWAAIGYRRAQAVALLLLSALITTCAVLTPLYSRALEQSLLRTAIDRVDPADTLLTLTTNRSLPLYGAEPPDDPIVPAVLESKVPASLAALYQEPIGSLSSQVLYEIFPGMGATELTMRGRDDVCAHLKMVEGACPTQPGQIAISAADAEKWTFTVGKVMTTAEKGSSTYDGRLTIVGVYEQPVGDPYWLGTILGGKSGTTVGDSLIPALDDWITPTSTFDEGWFVASVTAQYVLAPERVTLDDVPSLRRDVTALASNPAEGVQVLSSVDALGDKIESGREQVRLIVPLLMVQLALLAVVVLASVLGSAVEQRRPEVALARLRGRGPGGARRLVVGELGIVVLAGIPLGVLLAAGLSTLGRKLLLPAGVGFEVPWTTFVAIAVAVLVTLATVVLVALPVTREPIGALLRRVGPTRRRGGFATVDVVVIALAVAGVAGLVTGTVSGPLALITPTLLALAVGVLGARIWSALAPGSTSRGLGRRRLAGALSAWQISRRVSLRKVLTIITVATALAVFAVNAYLVADRNRTFRAELEAGAPTVLLVDGNNPVKLREAVTEVDPDGRTATPVALYRQRDSRALATLGVVPDQFSRIAYAAHDGTVRDWPDIGAPRTPTRTLTGKQVSATVSSTIDAGIGMPEIGLALTYSNGQKAVRSFGEVPSAGAAPRTTSTSLLCPEPCRVDGIVVEGTRADVTTTGTITLADVRVDGGDPLPLGDPSQWDAAIPSSAGNDRLRPANGSQGTTLLLDSVNVGNRMKMSYADVPVQLPVLLSGQAPAGGSTAAFESPDVHGRPVPMTTAQEVPSLPVVGARGVAADYDTMSRLGGAISPGGRLEVWLSTTSPTEVDRVVEALDAAGFPATVDRTYAGIKGTYDASASAWGLQLALFVALASVLMAGLVVVVVAVTSWRAVTRDFAALAMAGVPRSTLGAALRREQLLVVGVGVLLGGVCGLAGSWLATPLVPMFDVNPEAPVRSLAPAAVWIAITTVATLALLAAVGLVVARSVASRISFARLRDMA